MPSTKSRARVGVVVGVVAATAIAAAVILSDVGRGLGSDPDVAAEPDVDALRHAAGASVFFGHQSVGMNILEGIPGVYATAGIPSPTIVESPSAPSGEPMLAHAYIGQNGDPLGKVTAFAKDIRSGYGSWADVAFMKLCYVDVVAGTDVDALFAAYRQELAALEKQYPDVTFLHLTVPLTTEPGLKDRVKRILGRGSDRPSDNVTRERYNALVRAQYGDTGRLVDIAALESTTPDGQRASGQSGGQTYYALYDGYAADPGHLNATGAQVVAAGLLDVVGANAPR